LAENKSQIAQNCQLDRGGLAPLKEDLYVVPSVIAAGLSTLHVIKTVINDNDGISIPGDFNIHVKLGGVDVSKSPASGFISPGTHYILVPGTYVLSEDAFIGYNVSFGGDCDAGGNVILASGDKKTAIITNDDIPWTPENIPHNIFDLTTDGDYLYAAGDLVYDGYYKAAITKLTMGGVIVLTATYEPVLNSKGWWGAVCVSGNFVYVAGTIIYPTEGFYRAVIQKLNKGDLSLVWEYKFPLQTVDCEMRDIDVDATDVYGIKETYTGTAIGRVRISIADGSEVWRLGPTTLAGLGMICNGSNVYLTKGHSPKVIEDITKSSGAETDRTFESGDFARGVISGSDLYVCGYWSNAGVWNPSIHKIDTLTWTQTWKYADALTNSYYRNCVKDDDGVYGYGVFTGPLPYLVCVDLDGNLVWKKSIAGGYSCLNGITQNGSYLYVAFHKSNIGTIQKRLKSTGELVS